MTMQRQAGSAPKARALPRAVENPPLLRRTDSAPTAPAPSRIDPAPPQEANG